MASRRRWAALRYARLIAEVKRDTEVASAVEVGASNTVNQIANGDVVSVSNTQFQGYVSNTNAYIATKADSSSLTQYLQVTNASSVSAITDLSDVDISGATDGQVLTFNSSNNTITATTVSGGGGGGGASTGTAVAMALIF